VTVHWIDEDFKLHEALMAFTRLAGRHTRVRLANALFEILCEYEIWYKLFCCTTDAASNNKTMMKALSEKLWEEKQIDWDPQKMHIFCLDHIINLAVQAFLKELKVVKQQTSEDVEENDEDSGGESDGESDDDTDMREDAFGGTMAKICGLSKVTPDFPRCHCSVQNVRFCPSNGRFVRYKRENKSLANVCSFYMPARRDRKHFRKLVSIAHLSL